MVVVKKFGQDFVYIKIC